MHHASKMGGFGKSNILGGKPCHLHHESKIKQFRWERMVGFDKSNILGGKPLHMNH